MPWERPKKWKKDKKKKKEEDVAHIYNGILLSHKKEKIMPFAAKWMQLEIFILSGVCQKEKEKIIRYQLYLEFKIWHK